jgi:hypothetical protein
MESFPTNVSDSFDVLTEQESQGGLTRVYVSDET